MRTCFVIMPFKAPFDNYYQEVLKPAIKGANFKPLRGDEIYSNRPIIEEVIENIIGSDLIIADASGKNPNVNYELGFSHALRKQVIIISQSVDDVPFDYRHLRTIIYDTKKRSWKEQLKYDIRETIKTVSQDGFKKFESNSLNNFFQQVSHSNLLGLESVFLTRQSMNVSLEKLWHEPMKQLDVIAFGLRSFRDHRTNSVIAKVKAGLRIRILTIDPYSIFLVQREKDERLNNATIQKTIFDLVRWARDINKSAKIRNAVQVKFYDSLPLDFFWRQDSRVFVGPYLHGIDSQQTLTYGYLAGSPIGIFYSDYFEKLWKDKSFAYSKAQYRP